MRALEIGGYLQLEHGEAGHVHEGAVALDCGRNCLAYIVELRRIKTIWLPDWLCGSVKRVCRREGVVVRKYHVGQDMLPSCEFEVGPGEWLYLVDYYGQLRREDVDAAFTLSGGRLVVDETQGLYRPAWEGVDTLWTCRKWLGVPDGAYLATSDGARLARELPRAESRGRMAHVLGRAERPASEFLEAHREADVSFAAELVSGMSAITESLLSLVDHEAVKAKRRSNWSALHAALGDINGLNLVEPDVPFMYPLLAKHSDGIRARLAKNGVFVPTLWPDVSCDPDAGDVAVNYSEHILPLPMDQRYGAADMEYVVRRVKECLS